MDLGSQREETRESLPPLDWTSDEGKKLFRSLKMRSRKGVLREKRARVFWKRFLRDRQDAWFERHCPRGLPGKVKPVLRGVMTPRIEGVTRFDAYYEKKGEPRITGSGRTELGARFSVSLQLCLFVWEWKLWLPRDLGPFPCVLSRRGKVWRATRVLGLVRDLGGGEDPPAFEPFVSATGRTREQALLALARKLGTRIKPGKPPLHKELLERRRLSASSLERPEVSWVDGESRLIEDGG